MRPAPAAPRARLIFLGAVACLWLSVILVRLVDLQVVQHPDLARRARRQQQHTLEITPQRGVIYDRHGRELAVSIAVESVYAVPGEVTDPALAARLLAPVLELDSIDLENRLRSEDSFVWLKRKLDAEQARRVRALNLAGIRFQSEHKRFYPKRQLAAHVLGFVGVDEQGLAGLEYSLDEVIRGQPRRLIVTADGRRRWFARSSQVAREGASVLLTLDENIQYIAERELAAAIEQTGARNGTVIVQDPQTGGILAMANHPTFNPNEATTLPPRRHVNRAVTLAYEPGSTFKVVTVAAALEEALTNPFEVIDCLQGSIVLAGHRIRDHKPFGLLSVREIIYESSDVGSIRLALRLGEEKFYQHIRRWNFGEPTGIELPAESRGLLRPPSSWSRISIGTISMGQEIAITPLQLTAATSAIANHGIWQPPHVVKEIVGREGAEQLTRRPPERIIPEGVAEELKRMLTGVVTQGTGVAAQPVGYSAAGKTGTAEKIDETGAYSRTEFVASFAGFAPVEDPAVSVVVVLDSPRGELFHGGEVAAPVFRRIVERVLAYLNVPRDLPVSPGERGSGLQRASVQDFRPGQLDTATWLREDADVQVREAVHRRPGEQEDIAPAVSSPHARPGSIILLDEHTVAVPDLVGRSLREAAEECARRGLEPVLVGNGIAVKQSPAAGTRLPRGSRIRVEFRAALPAAPTRPM